MVASTREENGSTIVERQISDPGRAFSLSVVLTFWEMRLEAIHPLERPMLMLSSPPPPVKILKLVLFCGN
jgi:hypothetical protein